MADQWPRILARRTTRLSPWTSIIERDVEFSPGVPAQTYHAVGQADYLSILARTPDGRIPIVWQYRPAVEAFTWELPAGLVETGEDPVDSCRRELLEETGYPALEVHPLGIANPCTGRLSNRLHSFFVVAGDRVTEFEPEAGVTTRLVTPAELTGIIAAGEFSSQLHLGVLALAQLRGFFSLQQ